MWTLNVCARIWTLQTGFKSRCFMRGHVPAYLYIQQRRFFNKFSFKFYAIEYKTVWLFSSNDILWGTHFYVSLFLKYVWIGCLKFCNIEVCKRCGLSKKGFKGDQLLTVYRRHHTFSNLAGWFVDYPVVPAGTAHSKTPVTTIAAIESHSRRYTPRLKRAISIPHLNTDRNQIALQDSYIR